MNSIDNIWKQFGDDTKKISINFEPDKATWCVRYNCDADNGDSGTLSMGAHIERDEDMTKAAEKLLNWYKNTHTHKYVAESLWYALHIIEEATKVQDRQNAFTEKILGICKIKDEYMKYVDGQLIWDSQYDEEAKILKQPEASKPIKKPVKQEQIELQKKEKTNAPDDGFPPYFMKNSANYAISECWGYDIDGNRTHVVLDSSNPENCKIDYSTHGLDSESNITEISESEYNEIYDNVANTIAALGMGYGIRK